MGSKNFSPQELIEIEKYTKHFIFKFIQVVLQSRQNKKTHHPSRVLPARTDWFNLSIPDLPQIAAEIKNVFSGRPVDVKRPVCIEIYLKTTEDETMQLEYWWLVNSGKDSNMNDKYSVADIYRHFTAMLVSVLTASRVNPAYQLSRNQSATSYTILHKIRFIEPELSPEDNFKEYKLGTITTHLGMVEVHLACKEKFLIYPRKSSDLVSDIKDDYFNTENVKAVPFSNPNQDQNGVSGHQAVYAKQKRAAFAPSQASDISNENVEEVPFSLLLQHASESPITSRRRRSDVADTEKPEAKDDGIEIVVGCNMQQSGDSISNNSASSSVGGKDCTAATSSPKDDFVMVELRAPFAGPEEELGRFYREWQNTPSLSMFEEHVSYEETLNSITDQLAQFEASAIDFNEFVNSVLAIDS